MKLFVGAKGVVHYQGKVLLVRESPLYQDGAETGKWDVVGGRIEFGETVKDGLKREIYEESGLQVTVGETLGVFDGFPVVKGVKCQVVRIYFLCEADTDEVRLSHDHDRFAWVDPRKYGNGVLMNDIPEMLEMAAGKL